MKKVIAIDGPSGAGKSTIAREVAKALRFQYLDTGALYRGVAYYFFEKAFINFCSNPNSVRQVLDLYAFASDKKLKRELKNIKLDYNDGKVFLSGKDISEEIRYPEIGMLTSVFSARKVVRDFLLPVQRYFAEKYDIVAEGRDMTTVVFPDAWKKFYLDASPEVRTKRRYEQLKNLKKDITFDGAIEDIIKRDERDSSRKDAPLKRSKDAFYIDTSMLSIEEVVSIILKKVAEDG